MAASENESDSLTSKSGLVIAFDFGTTFTGVAFYHSGASTTIDVHSLAQSIPFIDTWPQNPQLQYVEKTPTVLAYNQVPPTWGGDVRNSDTLQVSRFKLGLEDDVPKLYGFSNDVQFGIHPGLPDKDPIDFTTDFLTLAFQHVRQVSLPKRLGKDFLRNQRKSFVVTVPAIWSDKAKSRTRHAAARAFGIRNEELIVITEPEAAALYCASVSDQVDLEPGSLFLVCDAGGGTVDLISYKIRSKDPFEIEECSQGTGAVCGATALEDGFQSLLRRKLGRQADDILRGKCLEGVKKYFETSIKKVFDYTDRRDDGEYEVPFKGVKDIPEKGLVGGYLTVTREEIQTVFSPVFQQIYSLIDHQLRAVEEKNRDNIQTLFLVGGLGSNLYLSNFLRSKLGSRIDIKRPINGHIAVMRGAVMHGLDVNLIKQRVMRRSYGVISQPVFREGHHPERLRVIDKAGVPRCKNVMHWYARKGMEIKNQCIITHTFSYNVRDWTYKQSVSLPHSSILYYSEEDPPPEYANQSSSIADSVYALLTVHLVKELCRIDLDLRKLPHGAFKRNRQVYHAEYQVGLTFGPELVLRLLHKGRVIAMCTARYFDART